MRDTRFAFGHEPQPEACIRTRPSRRTREPGRRQPHSNRRPEPKVYHRLILRFTVPLAVVLFAEPRSLTRMPRSTFVRCDIRNGSAAISCFSRAIRAALSAQSRSTVIIYKGTTRRLWCFQPPTVTRSTVGRLAEGRANRAPQGIVCPATPFRSSLTALEASRARHSR